MKVWSVSLFLSYSMTTFSVLVIVSYNFGFRDPPHGLEKRIAFLGGRVAPRPKMERLQPVVACSPLLWQPEAPRLEPRRFLPASCVVTAGATVQERFRIAKPLAAVGQQLPTRAKGPV